METKLIIDIETMAAPRAAILLEQSFVKPAGNTKKRETKDKQIAEKSAKLQESAALLDGSPVVILGGILDVRPFQIFTWDKDSPLDFDIPGVLLLPCQNEQSLLIAFKSLLEGLDGVCFVGHNVEKRKDISGFDLPHLRFRFAVHGIPLPRTMDPASTKSLDTMFLFWKSSHAKTLFVTLEEIAARLELTDKPFPIQGKDIPALWAAGDMEGCLLKNYFDLLLTQQVFSRLAPAF